MRNLLINLTFIFIFVLGGTSDAFSQRIGIIDILQVTTTYNIGIIDILNNTKGDNRLAFDNPFEVIVTISSLEEGNVKFLEHREDYISSNMRIDIPQKKFEKIVPGNYLLTIKIEDILIGTHEILIE